MSTSAYLVQTAWSLVAVLALGALAVFALRRSHGFGARASRGPLERLASLPLDARRAIYLVAIGESVIVIGASEGGLTKLAELPRSAVPDGGVTRTSERSNRTSFADVLAQLTANRSVRP